MNHYDNFQPLSQIPVIESNLIRTSVLLNYTRQTTLSPTYYYSMVYYNAFVIRTNSGYQFRIEYYYLSLCLKWFYITFLRAYVIIVFLFREGRLPLTVRIGMRVIFPTGFVSRKLTFIRNFIRLSPSRMEKVILRIKSTSLIR